MEINEMNMEQVEARLAEIEKELEAEGADLEALNKEVDGLNERKHAIEQAAAEKRALLDKVAGMKTAKVIDEVEEKGEKKMEKEFRNSQEYIEKYAEYVKNPSAENRAALLTENVDGEIAVPDLVYDEIKTAWNANEILSLVPTVNVRGNLKVQFEIAGSDAVKHTEGSGAVDEETLTEGIVLMVPAFFKKWKSFSDEVMAMRGEAFLRYIYREIAYRIFKTIADDLIDQIAKLPAVATAEKPCAAVVTEAPAVSTTATAMGGLSDEAGRPVVIMNKATWSLFKAAQYAAGFQIDPFEGLAVHYSSKLPAYGTAAAGAVYMIVGDFRQGALANFPKGNDIEYTFDDITRKKEDLVEVLGKIYAAVAPVSCGAFTLVKKPA